MIHVIAVVALRPATKASYLEELQAVLGKIRAEDGCLEYAPLEDLHLGLAREAEYRRDVVTLVERWADAAALRAHLGSAHMAEYRTRVADLVESVQLRVLHACASGSGPG